MTPRVTARRHSMDAAAVQVRFRDAEIRLASADLQLSGTSPHEWKHAAEIAISAGVAASDAICGHVLGYKVASDSHRDAVNAVQTASNAAIAKHLDTLLASKSAQAYGDRLPSHADAARLVLHARRMVVAATTVLAT